MRSRERGWVGQLVAMGSLPALPGGSGWNSGAGRRMLPLLLVSVPRGKGRRDYFASRRGETEGNGGA